MPSLRKSADPFSLIQATNPETGVIEYWLNPGSIFGCSLLGQSSSYGYNGEGSTGSNETSLSADYRAGWYETDTTEVDGAYTNIRQSIDPIQYTIRFKDLTEVSASIPMGKTVLLFQNPGTTDASCTESASCTSIIVQPVDFIEWDS